MSLLDELLVSAEEETIPSTTVDVSLAGKLITLRFEQLGGVQWAEITAKSPARAESPIDRRYGYNFQAAALKAAPLCGAVIEDGVPVKYEGKKWAALFAKLPGSDISAVCSAIWALNQWEPEQRLEALKKARLVVSEKKLD